MRDRVAGQPVSGVLDISLLDSFDLLAHLDLPNAALLLHHLCADAAQALDVAGLLVASPGQALSCSLLGNDSVTEVNI